MIVFAVKDSETSNRQKKYAADPSGAEQNKSSTMFASKVVLPDPNLPVHHREHEEGVSFHFWYSLVLANQVVVPCF
jgi:hypothetical protein